MTEDRKQALLDQMTEKQRLFCHRYLSNNFNATEAALYAGYSPKTAARTGSENLQKPLIKEYIALCQDEQIKRLEYDSDSLLVDLRETFKKCMGQEGVHIGDAEADGSPPKKKTFKFNPGAAARFAELIGKHINIQAYNEKKTVSVTERTTFVMDLGEDDDS